MRTFEQIYTAYRGISSRNKTDDNFDFYKPRKSFNSHEKAVGKFFTSTLKNAQSYGGKKVIQAELDFNDPLIVDADMSGWDGIEYDDNIYSTNDLTIKAKRDGNDGLIVQNVDDRGPFPGGGFADTIVALEPNTVKNEEIKLFERIYENVTAYRGTDHKNNIDNFDYFKPRQAAGSNGKAVGKFYSSSLTNAKSYGGRRITKAELDFDNPKIIHANNQWYDNIELSGKKTNTDKLTLKAKKMGHDGLIIKDVNDPGCFSKGELADTIVALEPDTIKNETLL